MSNIDKIRQKIERLKGNISVTHFAEELLSFIDSLQQEQPSENLEKAAEKQVNEALFKWSYDDEDGIEQYVYDSFIAGAEWQKEQMLKDAVEGVVVEIGETYKELTAYVDAKELNEVLQPLGVKDGDKVKAIIVKEGEE